MIFRARSAFLLSVVLLVSRYRCKLSPYDADKSRRRAQDGAATKNERKKKPETHIQSGTKKSSHKFCANYLQSERGDPFENCLCAQQSTPTSAIVGTFVELELVRRRRCLFSHCRRRRRQTFMQGIPGECASILCLTGATGKRRNNVQPLLLRYSGKRQPWLRFREAPVRHFWVSAL